MVINLTFYKKMIIYISSKGGGENMAIEYNGKNDYLNGCQNFRKDYEKGRYFLNMAYQDPDYRFASI